MPLDAVGTRVVVPILQLLGIIPVLERLAEFLTHEVEVLKKLERGVEDIRSELLSIHALLEHVESHGQVGKDDLYECVNEFKEVDSSAQDVIETFLTLSVGRSWIFYWVELHNLGKEVERIRKKLREISEKTLKYDMVVATLPQTSSQNAVEAPAVEKLSSILSRNLVRNFELKKKVEEVRNEVASMMIVVSNLMLKEQTSEREKVWLEEANTVSNFTISVVEGFIATKRDWFPRGMPMPHSPLLMNMLFPSEKKLMLEMKHIKTQVQGALRRRLTYGVGEVEEGVEDKIEPIPMVLFPPSLAPKPFLLAFLQLWIKDKYNVTEVVLRIIMSVESIGRDLALMHAFFRDIRGEEGLNERQKVWVKQLRQVAQHAEALLSAYELRMNQYNGGFWRLFQHIVPPVEFDHGINYMLYKMHNNWERKTIYDIANIERSKGSVSLDQSVQGSGSEIQIVVEHNDNYGTEENPLLPAGMSNNDWFVRDTIIVDGSTQHDMELMEALFRDAEEMGELDGRSKTWVEQMREIDLEIKSVRNKYASEDNNLFLSNIYMKINQIRNKIENAFKRRKRYGLIHLQGCERIQLQSPRPKKKPKNSGSEENVKVFLENLISDDKSRCIMSVIGIGGIGKTRLAKLIFYHFAIRNHFDYRVWVSSRQYSVELLVKGKAKQSMSIKKEDLTQILETYMKKKGCLVVVDDIETPIVWDTLKKAIPDMSTGCGLLLTSRNSKEVEFHSSFVHQVLLLDDEKSWVLFKKYLKVTIPPKLEKVAKQIVIKCGGLPSQILKIGGELSKKDVTYEEWSSMLQQLNQDVTYEEWSDALKTIDTLPIYLMRCLSYFVLFPAEYEIPTRRLIVLWVAEGLVYHRLDKESLEEVAERYLMELIDRNMVQVAKRKRNGKVKTCRLPHALRRSSFLQSHLSTDSDSVRKNPIIRQVADRLDQSDICYDHIHKDTIIASASLKSCYKDVVSFLSFDAQEGSKPGQDIGKFLNRCISNGCFLLLRVLDLEHVYKPQLPENIGKLSRLRYFGLRWTYLESLPQSISRLLKLQTLDLKHTYINVLPISIWKMQLRHLFLSETYRSRFPLHPKGNSLSDLQTLWGLFVDEKTPVKNGLDRLVNIRKLGLACQSVSLHQGDEMNQQLEAVAEWIMNLNHLQSLRLKSRKEDGLPGELHLKSLANHADLTHMYLLGILECSTIKSLFPRTLTELTLSHSNLRKESIEILGNLTKLQSLSLLAGSYIEETLHCRKGSFPHLDVLKLWKLKQLKEWTIEEGAFPRLGQLEIRSCECLKTLPDGLQNVSTLRQLKLTTMSENFMERVKGVDKPKIPSSCDVFHCYVSYVNEEEEGEQKFTCNLLDLNESLVEFQQD